MEYFHSHLIGLMLVAGMMQLALRWSSVYLLVLPLRLLTCLKILPFVPALIFSHSQAAVEFELLGNNGMS